MRLARISRAAGVVALLAVGALVLHQLRYLLAFGGGAGAELERDGHGYLQVLLPALVAVAVAALVVSVVAPAILRRTSGPARGSCTTERAAGYAAALLAVHLAQELAEGVLTTGHSADVAGVLGAGGFAVLPLAMVLGALASLARGWLERAERRLAVALHRDPLPRAPRRMGAPTRRAPRPALSSLGLCFGIARRPPPVAQRA